VLSVNDIANYLKIHINTVFRYIKQGKIKAIKIGGIWRVSEEEFERIKKEGV